MSVVLKPYIDLYHSREENQEQERSLRRVVEGGGVGEGRYPYRPSAHARAFDTQTVGLHQEKS